MAQVSITIETYSNFEGVADEAMRINDDLNEAMYFATSENTDALHDAAVENINKDRPKTYETIEKEVVPIGNGGRGHVFTDDMIALILEDGSVPHEIWGNPFLRFESGGGIVFRRRVFHPGTQPYNWFARSWAEEEPMMRERYVAAVAAVLGD